MTYFKGDSYIRTLTKVTVNIRQVENSVAYIP